MFTSEHRKLSHVMTAGLSRGRLCDLLDGLHRLESHVGERRLAVLAAIDDLGDGGLDATETSRSITRRSRRASQQAAKTATQLKGMPLTRAALAGGDISGEHAAAVADAAERTSDEDADSALAGIAAAMPADLFTRKAREWTSANEPEVHKQTRHDRQREARECITWRDANGMFCLSATLDPVTGRQIRKALGQRVDTLWHADGGREGTPDEVRSPEQRRADALAQLLLEDPAETTARKPHPKHMFIVHLNAHTGVAEFTDGESVPASVLETLALDAEFVGVVFGTEGEILHLGRSVRLASRAQWIGLIARDQGCKTCGVDPSYCDAHHAGIDWQDGAKTDIDVLELQCGRDHALIHQHDSDRRRRRSRDTAA